MYIWKFGAENPTGSEDSSEKAEFTVFKDDDLEIRWP